MCKEFANRSRNTTLQNSIRKFNLIQFRKPDPALKAIFDFGFFYSFLKRGFDKAGPQFYRPKGEVISTFVSVVHVDDKGKLKGELQPPLAFTALVE